MLAALMLAPKPPTDEKGQGYGLCPPWRPTSPARRKPEPIAPRGQRPVQRGRPAANTVAASPRGPCLSQEPLHGHTLPSRSISPPLHQNLEDLLDRATTARVQDEMLASWHEAERLRQELLGSCSKKIWSASQGVVAARIRPTSARNRHCTASMDHGAVAVGFSGSRAKARTASSFRKGPETADAGAVPQQEPSPRQRAQGRAATNTSVPPDPAKEPRSRTPLPTQTVPDLLLPMSGMTRGGWSSTAPERGYHQVQRDDHERKCRGGDCTEDGLMPLSRRVRFHDSNAFAASVDGHRTDSSFPHSPSTRDAFGRRSQAPTTGPSAVLSSGFADAPTYPKRCSRASPAPAAASPVAAAAAVRSDLVLAIDRGPPWPVDPMSARCPPVATLGCLSTTRHWQALASPCSKSAARASAGVDVAAGSLFAPRLGV